MNAFVPDGQITMHHLRLLVERIVIRVQFRNPTLAPRALLLETTLPMPSQKAKMRTFD
jgi:hypothetical protein